MVNFRSVPSLTAALVLLLGGLLSGASASAQEITLRWRGADGGLIAEKTLSPSQVDALAQTEFVTHTPWTEGPQTFRGPPLRTLAALADAPADEAEIMAWNEYSATLPAEDWQEHGAILASRLNGKTMRLRDKGPYWIMYPIDGNPGQVNTQRYHARMVWQVRSIEFRDH